MARLPRSEQRLQCEGCWHSSAHMTHNQIQEDDPRYAPYAHAGCQGRDGAPQHAGRRHPVPRTFAFYQWGGGVGKMVFSLRRHPKKLKV